MTSSNPSPELADAMTDLLNQAGCGVATGIEPLPRGRNNRAYRVTGHSGPWLLKQYFRNASGERDRCESEWAWSSFCWQHGVTCVPKPLACDKVRQVSLFEFIDGRHLLRDEIDSSHVEQAAEFVAELNRLKHVPAAADLPVAAEACFSIGEHCNCVERRIARLCQLPMRDTLDEQLHDWLNSSLAVVWRTISDQLKVTVSSAEFGRELSPSQRCLSPSDFGFHNAVLTSSGRLRFFDFEYAGWDDPAKLVCDFFWQQELPAPREFTSCLVAVLADGQSQSHLEQRVNLLTPVYGVKWCCLVLNEFIAEDRRRREFAQTMPVTRDRREEQFERAKRLLVDVQSQRQ